MIKALQKYHFLVGCLLAVFVLRAITLEALSLMDPTESRYAFIAAEMASSGDWVTPKLPYPEGVIPYLGKPPLHFWLTAASISLFGGDEWCVRLPSFLGLITISACLFFLFKRQSVEQGIIASLISASIAFMFFFGGSSVVDVTLAVFTTLGIVGYIMCAQYNALRPWQLIFFASLGLGFLTKGPVAVVLTILPLIAWHLLDRSRPIPRLYWKRGILLSVLIPLPWFILSEIRNPGFTYYFFVQENFLRYVTRNYGDKYGSGHRHFYGSVWWMFGAGLLPWTPLLLLQLRKSRALFAKRNFLLDLGAAWCVSMLLFFTFIRQLHAGYVIPALPGAAVMLTAFCMDQEMRATLKVYLKYVTALMLGLTIVMVAANCYLNSSSDSFILCFFVAAATLLFYYLFERERRSTPLFTTREFALSILTLASFYSTTNLAMVSWVDDLASAEGILAYVTATEHKASSDVSTITRNTFSHYYYGREWSHELSHAVNMSYVDPNLIMDSAPNNIIVSQKELKEIPKSTQNKYVQVHTIGKWIWLAKKTVHLLHSTSPIGEEFLSPK